MSGRDPQRGRFGIGKLSVPHTLARNKILILLSKSGQQGCTYRSQSCGCCRRRPATIAGVTGLARLQSPERVGRARLFTCPASLLALRRTSRCRSKRPFRMCEWVCGLEGPLHMCKGHIKLGNMAPVDKEMAGRRECGGCSVRGQARDVILDDDADIAGAICGQLAAHSPEPAYRQRGCRGW